MTRANFISDLTFVLCLGGWMAFVLIATSCQLAKATGPTVYRDRQGRVVATSTTSGNRTVYRESGGRVLGTATTDGKTTTYMDRSGKTILKQSGPPSVLPFLKDKR